MSAEIDCYKLSRNRDDILEQSFSVAPGGAGFISYSENVKLVTQCEKENKRCSVLITGQNPMVRLALILHKDKNDYDGEWISFKANKPIWIEGDQRLFILFKKYIGKDAYNKRISIYLDKDDSSYKDPIGSPEDRTLMPV